MVCLDMVLTMGTRFFMDPLADDFDEGCPICQENLEAAAELTRQLPCLHLFHKACIDAWLVRSDTCPLWQVYI